MSMRSTIMDQQSRPSHDTLGTAASNTQPVSIETLRRRVEVAEATARALEQENKQLRSERAKAVLEAARTENSLRVKEPSAIAELPDEFHELSRKLRFAEELLRAAEQERDTAIRTIEETLKKEFVQQIDEIRQNQTAEIASKSDEAAKRAWQDLGHQVDALANKLSIAESALIASRHESDAAVRAIEGSLREELSRRVEEMRQSHAADLVAQAQRAKTQFAEELMSSLASANAAWKKRSDELVQKANRRAADDLGRARVAWRSRSRIALLRTARTWRTKERKRLADAKAQWQAMRRKALEAADRRWQVKLGRQAKTVRRPLRQSEVWQRGRDRISRLVKFRLWFGHGVVCRPEFKPSAIGHAGCMAALLILVTVIYSPIAPFASPDPEQVLVGTAAPLKLEAQSAKLPDVRAGGDASVASTATVIRRFSPATPAVQPEVRPKKKAPDTLRQPKSTSESRATAPDAGKGSNPQAQASAPKAGMGSSENHPTAQLTEVELRSRLQQKLRNLRMGLSAQ